MKRLVVALVGVVALSTGAAAQDINCGAKGPVPKSGEIKLVSWNIAELASAVKVYDRSIRTEDEFDSLREYRACHDGDVYALQEIASLRALGRIFPPSEYILCISGQPRADEKGLAPDYPRDQLGGIEPECVSDPTAAVSTLPGELTTPARQYVALAIKRSSGISLATKKDVVDLGLRDPVTNQSVRWGLDVTLTKGAAPLRLLVVHLKSRCNEAPIEEPSSNENCPALYRQMPHLKKWIYEAAQAGPPAIVVGDFNRRFDRESVDVKATDMWDVMTGASTAAMTDDVNLTYVPKNKEFKCWPIEPASQRFSIDFFVLTPKAQAIADPSTYWKWRYGRDIEENTPRDRWPSDHCPIQLNVKLP
jgi:hypothetical protein